MKLTFLQSIAIACVFLSAKVEEAPKKVGDIINVYHHLMQKRDGVEKPEPLHTSKQVLSMYHLPFY